MKICECGSEVLDENMHRDPNRNTHKPSGIQEVEWEPWTAEDARSLLTPEDEELL